MPAAAQNDSKTTDPGCPAAAEVQPRHLHGLWRAEFEGAPGATLLIEPHREFAMSISGTVNRNGTRAQLAGDLEEGEFTLEESADGSRIGATWLGDVVEGSCGREIRGTWQAEGASRPDNVPASRPDKVPAPSAIPFVLRKQAER